MPRDFAKPIEKDPLEDDYPYDMPSKKAGFPWWAGLIIVLLIINGGLFAYFLSQDKSPDFSSDDSALPEALTTADSEGKNESITLELPESDSQASAETTTATDVQLDSTTANKQEEETEYEFYNWLAQDNTPEDEDEERLPIRDVFKVQKQLEQSAEQTRDTHQELQQHNLESPPEVSKTENKPTVISAAEKAIEEELTSSNSTNTQPAPLIRYSLQVGSFQKLEDAKRHLAFLTEQGFKAYTYQAQINNKTWNRVIVGDFEGRESMEAARNTLKELGIDSLIIPIKD